MKNIVKIATLTLSFTILIASTACSGSSANSEFSKNPNESTSSTIESSIVDESSETVSSNFESSVYEATSTSENSMNSNSSAVDPAVEERSYSDEEKYEEQDTRIPNYKYQPFCKEYIYSGNESKVIIPSDFTICPGFPQSTSTSVKEIIVPESVTKIPAAAFGGCSNLEKLVILNPDCEIEGGILPPDSNGNALSNNNKLVDIYFYFRSDKTIPKNHLYGGEGCSKVFNSVGGYYLGKNFENYLHDLATESYE